MFRLYQIFYLNKKISGKEKKMFFLAFKISHEVKKYSFLLIFDKGSIKLNSNSLDIKKKEYQNLEHLMKISI